MRRMKKYNRLFKKNEKIIKNCVLLCVLFFISIFINLNSQIGFIIDLVGFGLFLYITPSTFSTIFKKVDKVNLERDIHCLGMKVFGLCVIFIGFIVLSFGYVIQFEISGMLMKHIVLIIGLIVLSLGLFSVYRSTRRYGVFVYCR